MRSLAPHQAAQILFGCVRGFISGGDWNGGPRLPCCQLRVDHAAGYRHNALGRDRRRRAQQMIKSPGQPQIRTSRALVNSLRTRVLLLCAATSLSNTFDRTSFINEWNTLFWCGVVSTLESRNAAKHPCPRVRKLCAWCTAVGDDRMFSAQGRGKRWGR